MFFGGRISSGVAALAVAFGVILRYYYSKKNTPAVYEPWHNNKQWEELFSIYDEMANNSTFGKTNEEWGSCRSIDIATTYGTTHAHICEADDESRNDSTTVLMFHGAGSNSLIYSDWITPPLLKSNQNFRTISIDFPCDCGRSLPLNGNVLNCPQTEEALADWAAQVLLYTTGRSTMKAVAASNNGSAASTSVVHEAVHTIGYSYGCYVSFVLARYRPELVDRQIFLAPASIYAPISVGYLIRALYYGLTLTDTSQNWFFKYMAAKDSNFTSLEEKLDTANLRLVRAIRNVAATVLAVHPIAVDDSTLKRVTDEHPTLLIIGEEEKVFDPQVAVEHAEKAGVQVKFLPSAGHLMLMEQPAHDIIEVEVLRFLTDKRQSSA